MPDQVEPPDQPPHQQSGQLTESASGPAARVGRGAAIADAVADRLPPAVSAWRWAVRPAAAVALLVVALALVGGALARHWSQSGQVLAASTVTAASGSAGAAARSAPRPTVPPDTGAGAGAGRGPTTGPTGAAGRAGAPAGMPATTSAAAPVLVHVVGEVRRPGVVSLRAGQRVQDAVRAAGGPAPKADLARLNLARPVQDGEQVVVPARGQPAPQPVDPPPAAGSGSAGRGAGGSGAAPTGAAAGSPVSLSSATLGQLDELPGIGPVLAQRIVDWRTANGPFTSVDELAEVPGIGDKLLAGLRELVRP